MIQIAVCDDEENTCLQIYQYVVDYLKQNRITANVERYHCGEDLLAAFQKKEYRILLLDIYLREHSGVELARQLRNAGKDFDLCFITSSPDFALEGYRVKALDYLVKPVAKEAVADFLKRCLGQYSQFSRSISIKVDYTSRTIPVRDIYWINSINQNTFIHMSQDVLKTWHSLKELEAQLGGHPFYRISRSYLVNFDQVRRLEADHMLMTDGSTVPFPIHHKYQQAARSMYLEYLSRRKDEPKRRP